MITADQIIAHMIGDYILQSDYMALEKTKKSVAALAHVITYALPFLAITTSWKALAVIVGTHFIIDRWRLARYVCWLKNWLAPRWIERPSADPPVTSEGNAYPELVRNYPWAECVGTGYHKDRPPWLATWLMFIADNTLHMLCNGLAIHYLGAS